MSSYGGRYIKGASKERRAEKRADADLRNALTPPERRKSRFRGVQK
jgi:hypothetical protein